MSDTPRTDKEEFYAGDLDGGVEAVPADFARKLERELAAESSRAAQARKEAYEQAAKVCDAIKEDARKEGAYGEAIVALECAEAIRALAAPRTDAEG